MTGSADELELFRQYASSRSRPLRNQLVERHMGLAVHVARRYTRPGHEDDIRQAAMLGLVKAVDRFDPEYGVSFTTFAGATIEGELKRYLRDRTWTVRVPRAAKELHLLVRRAADELLQVNGRSPSVDEIARHLDIERDDVLRGLAASAAQQVASIDATPGTDGPTNDRRAALAQADRGLDQALDAHAVEQLLARLPEREREIVRLRFFEDRSQSEIAEVVGISQMHVSRLLRRSFEQLRAWLDGDDLAGSS
jgi:RNA polymerase sigma-B factor